MNIIFKGNIDLAKRQEYYKDIESALNYRCKCKAENISFDANVKLFQMDKSFRLKFSKSKLIL